MDYDKVYFPKTEMSQLVPTGYFSPETYAAYAESFDLSLLPSEPLQFELNQCQSEFITLADYMPTTFNDNQSILMTIKTEKSIWSSTEDLNQLSSNNNLPSKQEIISNSSIDSSILLQQLQKQYQFYPSPLPSPPQYDFNHSITSVNNNNYSPIASITQLPPSPSPSIEPLTPASANFNTFSIKKEYLILPPSPPESNGAPSPFSEIKSEPGDIDTENFIDINTLLEKSIIHQFDTTTSTAVTPSTPVTSIKNNSDINIIKKSVTIGTTGVSSFGCSGAGGIIVPQDHQVLREYLQDTTFQKKHNLKPLALESLIGGFSVRGDIEPVISLALEHAKRDAQATCANLQISLDPQQWTTTQVHAWIRSTIEQFKLSQIDNLESQFPENGANLLCLTEEEFVRRVPESGGTIHAQLEIWKLACCENFLTDTLSLQSPSTSNWVPDCPQNMDITDDEDDDLPSSIMTSSDDPIVTKGNTLNTNTLSTTSTTILNNTIAATTSNNNISSTSSTTSSTTTQTSISTTSSAVIVTPKPPRTGGSHIHLWQFLKELLATPQLHGTAIRWLDRNKGVFKIEDSVRVAKLWGRRKNRPAMNYDKLSRSIRQYYKKGIMKKTERSQRLVYQFCHPYCL